MQKLEKSDNSPEITAGYQPDTAPKSSPSPAPPPSPEPSARELDALVAERLFGWIRVIVCGLSASGLSPTRRDTFSDVPHYSTGPAAMMEVVEAMKAKGYWCCIQSPFTPTGEWHVGFTPHGVTGWNGRPDFEAHADNPMRATALAALAAPATVPPEGTVRL